MAKHALVIRPDYNPLDGFANSAACIAQALRARGFEIVSCADADATRAGILGAYDALIDRARPDDAVVLYYVGHGGLVTSPSYTPGDGLPPRFQHICPTDFPDTTDADFRGISAPELSLQLAALTRKTKNVTVILECCFAAQMSRGDDPPGVQRVPPTLTRAGLTAHVKSLRQRYGDAVDLAVTGNSDAVRVAATGQIGSAFQTTLPPASALPAFAADLPEGGWICAMTLALVEILGEIGDRRVTWRSIGEALRARLTLQRPEVEGPVSRVPFSLATVDAMIFDVRAAGDGTGAIVNAGRLLGVSVGDVYGVMPVGSTEIDPAQLIAEITIDEATAVESRARDIAWWQPGMTTLPPNTVAIPRSLAFDRYPVRVVADAAQLPAIEDGLQSSARVRPLNPLDRDPLATLHVHENTLELRDELGPLFSPSPYPARLLDAVRDLENLATVRRLRTMADPQGAPDGVSVDLLVVDPQGAYRELDNHGDALGLGDRVAVRLVNQTSTQVFAHVFNIGLRARIAMLSDPGGIRLVSGTPAYCGAARTGRLAGFGLRWPADLPSDQPRTDTVMVVITQQPADLSALAREEHLSRSVAPVSPLEALIGQIARGGSRGTGDEPARAPSPFAMLWRDYQLFPLSGSLDYGAPQVDASPPGAPPPRGMTATVQVHLDTLVAAADTRVDVLVCGRSSTAPYCATTVIGPAPGPVVIWTGALQGTFDIYVWTSRQHGDPRTLADLLAQQPIRELTAMLCRPDDGVRSQLAAGASMQLAALARAALRGPSRDVTTAFHGSFGAGDRRTTCTTTEAAFAISLGEPTGT